MGKAVTCAAICLLAIIGQTGCTSLPGSSAFSGPTLEQAIVFQPRVYPEGHWSPVPDTEEAWFDSPDGTRLHGWFAESREPRAVVLYCHGNAGNVTHRRDVLTLFRDQLNCSILVFDYRGYGRSEGKPTEEGVLADARAARKWLAARAGVREVDIVLVGHSLGGGVAVDLAARDGARGLVLENTFTSLPDVAFAHIPVLPFRLLMHSRLDSLAKISHYRGPLLIKHGDADETVPYNLGKRLFAAANEPKRFISIPGGRHNDPPTPEYLTALRHFLDDLSVLKTAARD
jgi:fermentation-respiration switch protein FrsA (DUF1100 family)